MLGFKIEYDRAEERFAFLDRGGARLMIEQTVDPARRLILAEPVHPFGRGMNLQVPVDDVDALYEVVVAAGAPIVLPREEREYRRGTGSVRVRQFVVADPDGYLLRLSQVLADN